MISSLFEKKPVFSASVAVSLFFVALALSVAGSIDFSHREKRSAVVSWSSQAGSGISVPACSASAVGNTCANGYPVIQISTDPCAEHSPPTTEVAIWVSGVLMDTLGGYVLVGSEEGLTCGETIEWSAAVPRVVNGSGNPSPQPPEPSHFYAWDTAAPSAHNVPFSTGSFTTQNCAGSGANAPVAEAGISKDGSLFGASISVIRGVPANIWFSADRDVTGDGRASRDPDGWNDSANGVSAGGKCEWNIDLARPGFSVQRTVSDPASPAACNLGPFAKTFNDAPGTYLYEVLQITDAAVKASEIASVFVTVASPVSVGLVANPPIINPGGTSELTWNTEGFGPGDCSIDQGIGAVSFDGTKLVSPAVTTVYTLSCSNGTNSGSTQATVYVSTVPTIKEIPPR